MKGFVYFMKERRWLNILLLSIYFIAVVLPHKRFGTFLNETVVGGLGINNNTPEGRQEYNFYALSIVLILLIILLYFIIRNTRKLADRKLIWGFMILNIILAGLIIKFLFVVNIECVHFFQYAAFAILLYPLVGNYQSTLVWTTIAGMIDEAYQYFYLAPMDTSHYDFNDVVTNLVGAVFGLLLLRSVDIQEHNRFNLKRATFWIGLATIILVVIGLHVSDIMSIYPSEEHNYHILREMPNGFWSKISPNVTYHIVRPIEGVIMTVGLWLLYSKLSPRVKLNG